MWLERMLYLKCPIKPFVRYQSLSAGCACLVLSFLGQSYTYWGAVRRLKYACGLIIELLWTIAKLLKIIITHVPQGVSIKSGLGIVFLAGGVCIFAEVNISPMCISGGPSVLI